MVKLAILTGGSTGIGRHLVKSLAGAGYHVAFSFRSNPDAAQSLCEEMNGLPVLKVQADVGVSAEVARFHRTAVEWAGVAPEVLVNNAGIQTWSSLLDLKEEDWDKVIQTNLKGCFLNTQLAAKLMVAHGISGSIINLGSGCNKIAFPKLVDYTASKGGIEQFTKVAAVELGPHGIRVNCIAPGAIATERTAAEAGEYATKWAKVTPLRRVGTPEDIVGPLLFFTSPASEFVTGQTLWVDGGAFTQANWPYET
jgi:3-oxoacyl-[acyl-carrier protein] reductase